MTIPAIWKGISAASLLLKILIEDYYYAELLFMSITSFSIDKFTQIDCCIIITAWLVIN